MRLAGECQATVRWYAVSMSPKLRDEAALRQGQRWRRSGAYRRHGPISTTYCRWQANLTWSKTGGRWAASVGCAAPRRRRARRAVDAAAAGVRPTSPLAPSRRRGASVSDLADPRQALGERYRSNCRRRGWNAKIDPASSRTPFLTWRSMRDGNPAAAGAIEVVTPRWTADMRPFIQVRRSYVLGSRDTGTGIPPDVGWSVRPFFTTRAMEGTGLGPAWCAAVPFNGHIASTAIGQGQRETSLPRTLPVAEIGSRAGRLGRQRADHGRRGQRGGTPAVCELPGAGVTVSWLPRSGRRGDGGKDSFDLLFADVVPERCR